MFISTRALNAESLMRLPGLFSRELMFLKIKVKMWKGSLQLTLYAMYLVNLKPLHRSPKYLLFHLCNWKVCYSIFELNCFVVNSAEIANTYCSQIAKLNFSNKKTKNKYFVSDFICAKLASLHKTESIFRPLLYTWRVNPQILLGYNLLW